MLAAAQTLVKAVRTSALTNAGWSVAAIASDPNVQAAIVPVLEAAANCSALNWAEVDPSVVPTAAPQVWSIFPAAWLPANMCQSPCHEHLLDTNLLLLRRPTLSAAS